MKNTFGTNICVTLFGESHGEEIGCVLDGFPSGLPFDRALMEHQLSMRRPQGKISTSRSEPDPVRIVSGLLNEKTTGTAMCFLIPNTQTRSNDYNYGPARPGHADYAAFCKYHGDEDYRGGGHFSGRVTAALAAAGAVAIGVLRKKGIVIGTHIKRCAGIDDRALCADGDELLRLSDMPFAVLDEAAADAMKKAIEAAASEGDSVGGILETCVVGMPAGAGEPWFDSVESILSHALFSIPAIKGVEFGAGFGMADLRGSTANDALHIENGRITTATNNNGGINGGITNGMPLIIRCAVKPTPSIFKEQQTVNFVTGENTVLKLSGRHDPAIVHRARVVADSVIALALCDILATRFGNEWFRED